MTKCPYCGGGDIKPPKVKKFETPSFAHGSCNTCGRKPRATVSWSKDGKMYASYGRDGRRKKPAADRKSVHLQGLISPRQLGDVLAGKRVLRLDKRTRGGYTVSI